jgi:hypothetical protein
MNWPIPSPTRSPDIRHSIFWGYVIEIVYANLGDSVKDLPLKNMMGAATVTPALLAKEVVV